MNSTPKSAVHPQSSLISSLAIWPSDLPSRHEVLDTAAQNTAEHDPEGAGEVSELRRQDRSHQRSGSGDGGKMMTEHYPLVGGHEIMAVLKALRGGGALIVEFEHAQGDKPAVEPVADRIDARRCRHQPDSVQRLTSRRGDHAEPQGAREGNQHPRESLQKLHSPLSVRW